MSSLESSPRDCRSHAANPVTGAPGSVHPIGHPIRCSKKRGLEVRLSREQLEPCLKLMRSGSEQGALACPGCHPNALRASHIVVQVRAAFVTEYWPQLPSAMSTGLTIASPCADIVRSGK